MANRTKAIVERMRRLAHDERGDSIPETLVAVLIAALGAAALATMVTVSANVTMSMDQERTRIYEAESSMQPTSTLAEVSVEVSGKSTEFEVRVYTDDDKLFYRYVDENGTSG